MSKKAGIKKNLLYSLVYQILAIILPLITSPYVARVLGAKSVGIYSKSQALANYFLLFAMLGVNNYGNRSIARVRNDRKTMSRTFWEIYSFQLITSVVVSSLYFVYCIFVSKNNTVIYMMQMFYVVSAVIDVNWCCFGLENFRLTTIRSMVVKVITVVAIFVFVRDDGDLWIYTIIMSSSFLVSNIVVWPYILKEVDFVKPKWKGIVCHIKPNMILFWPIIAVSLYNIMDKLMLGFFCNDEEVAFYTYSERIVTIPTTLILALDNVVMPRISNMYATEQKSDKIKKLMDSIMLFAMLMAAAFGFGLAGVAKVFAPWFYGKAFVKCGYFIRLLCPVIIVKTWAGALRTQYIIPTGKDKIYAFSLTAGAIVNLILNILLIPRMAGVGAIIGTIAAEFTVCFLQFYCCRKDIDIKGYMINGLSFCVVGGIMFFVVASMSSIASGAVKVLLAQIVVGGIVYVIGATFYMIRIRKNPILVNEFLKIFKVKYRFKCDENRA